MNRRGTEAASSWGRMKLCHVRRVGGRAAFALFGAWLVLIGCGKAALEPEGEVTCSSDAECPVDERCQAIPTPGQQPNVVPPCMANYTSCSSSAACSNGQVCWPLERSRDLLPPNCFVTGRICGPPCSINAFCLADEVCETNGECRQPACTEANAVACPDHWRCDPAAAETEIVQPVAGANEQDSGTYARDVLRGCARIGCDEAGGFTCKDGWVCDPENATDPSGCVALPCVEAGLCSDPARFICQPTSSASRPTGTDAHGCVLKNCEEGVACRRMLGGVEVGYCDFDGPLADDFGCASRRCDEPGSLCIANMICDPESTDADARGCVSPPSTGGGGVSGSGGSPAGGGAAEQGAQGGTSSAGRGGSGGRSGSGGSGGTSGTSGSAGTATADPTGRCVDR